MADDDINLSKTEARGGSTPGIVRYVLAASLVLIVVLFAGILLLFR